MVLVGFLYPTPASSEPEVVESVKETVRWNKETITKLAQVEARKRGVNEEAFLRTIACEIKKDEDGEWVADGQSQVPAKGPNGKEDSWGVAQIHLPSHPHITRAQAQDPTFALPWAAQEFAEGRAKQWTCYRKLHE